jgi:hypothetical protein
MEKRLFDYMDMNYVLGDSNIVHTHFGGKDYGRHIAEEITLIFSVELSISEQVVKQWISNKIDDLENLDKFWSKPNLASFYEPKRPNRFMLLFPDEFEIPHQVVKTTVRPSVTFNNGRVEWEDIEIIFRDPIGPSMAERMHELFLRVGSSYTNREFEYRIQLLGPVGDLVEEWVIRGFVSRIDFGELDYSSDELMDIKLTIRPTSCILLF